MIHLALVPLIALAQADGGAPPKARIVPATKVVAAPAQPKQADDSEPTVFPGSTVPFPDVGHWIKGDAPKGFEPGKVYVVEFWATWCGPCRTSMPHISEIQEKYAGKGVTVMGISDEDEAKVRTFIESPEWSSKTRYVIGTDPDMSTKKQYMMPAMQRGIPCSFIVKDGTVQWIGHPMGIDEPLAAVVAGTWSTAEAKTEFMGEIMLMKSQRELMMRSAAAAKSGDWAPVLTMLDTLIASSGGDAALAMKVRKFEILVGPAGKPEQGYALGRELVSANPPAQLLNQLAWYTLDDQDVKTRDLDFAMDAAQRALKASPSEDAAILDTLARAHWEKGQRAEAIAVQKRAIGLASGPMRESLEETLKRYQAGS